VTKFPQKVILCLWFVFQRMKWGCRWVDKTPESKYFIYSTSILIKPPANQILCMKFNQNHILFAIFSQWSRHFLQEIHPGNNILRLRMNLHLCLDRVCIIPLENLKWYWFLHKTIALHVIFADCGINDCSSNILAAKAESLTATDGVILLLIV